MGKKKLLLGGFAVAALAVTAGCSQKTDKETGLVEDAEKRVFVTEVLAMTGLHNDVRVVQDPQAKGCAYANTIKGKQYIGVDPGCVGGLYAVRGYRWFAVGVLTHEIGHLLGGHTVSGTQSPHQELEADEWSGWAMYRLGATLNEAVTTAQSMSKEGSATHPPRLERVAAVQRGWARAAKEKEGVKPNTVLTDQNVWTNLLQQPPPWLTWR